MLQIQVLASGWEKKKRCSPVISCQWKGWILTYICAPPLSTQLHSCCCYVMSVCYETLHWSTQASRSASSHIHTQTHKSCGDFFYLLAFLLYSSECIPFFAWKPVLQINWKHGCYEYMSIISRLWKLEVCWTPKLIISMLVCIILFYKCRKRWGPKGMLKAWIVEAWQSSIRQQRERWK